MKWSVCPSMKLNSHKVCHQNDCDFLDSIHVNKKEEEPKRKKVTTKFNKPSRVDLLREWRNKKEAEKKVMEKARKG